MPVSVERVYDFIEQERGSDDYVVLVDRIWPRGISKDTLELDEWAKELAPSGELRRWFGHDPDRWQEFQQRYLTELSDWQSSLDRLRQRAQESNLVLLYAARDEAHNQARVLAELVSTPADKQ